MGLPKPPGWVYKNRVQIARALVLLESIIILLFSIQPGMAVQVPFLRTGDLEHLAAYFVYGGLLCASSSRPGRKTVLAALIIGSLFGLFNEVIQGFLPYRFMDPLDWAIDTIGAGLGAFAFYKIRA